MYPLIRYWHVNITHLIALWSVYLRNFKTPAMHNSQTTKKTETLW